MRIHKPCRVGVRNVGARPPTPPNGDMRNNGYHINVASRDLPLAKVGEFRIGSLTKPCAVGAMCESDWHAPAMAVDDQIAAESRFRS